MADKVDGIIISEILADNAGGQASDTDGDGRSNKADEFVEIQNTTNSAISLDGYEIWSEKQGQLYSFGASDTIAAGGTATVVGNYDGTPPADFYSGGAAENANWLPDGEGPKFDSIFLVNTNTGEYVVLSYGNPPRAPTLPNNFPGTTQVGAGEQIDSNAPNGTAFARDVDGDFEETSPDPGEPGVPCFVNGTMIETTKGGVAVEHLQPGMVLETRDAGPQPVLAIRAVAVSAQMLRAHPDLRPVTLLPGQFGAKQALTVSPAHRILLQDPRAQLLFGCHEVFAAAHQLLGYGAVVRPGPQRALTYYHILLADHHVLCVQGVWTESLLLGDVALAQLTDLAGWQVLGGVDLRLLHHAHAARIILRRYEAEVILHSPTAASLRNAA